MVMVSVGYTKEVLTYSLFMEPQTRAKYIKIAAAFLGAVILIVAGYFFYTKVYPGTKSEQSGGNKIPLQGQVSFKGKPAPVKPFELTGKLYLSLLKNDPQDVPRLYTYAPGEASTSVKVLSIDRPEKNGSFSLSPSISSDGKKMVFARGEAPASGKIADSVMQIYTSDISGKNVTKITSAAEVFKRDPVFSPSGNLIAYIARENIVSVNPDLPESWTTYLTDNKGVFVKVANGTNPIFSPDGKTLLIIQKDGVYSFNISDWKKPVAGKFVFFTSTNRETYSSKMTVSPDGTMLAISSDIGVSVSKINWETFKLDRLMLVSTNASWLTFSPDGKYLAISEWRKGNDGNGYPVLMGYDLSNGASEELLNVSAYDKAYIWLGSWK